MRFVPLLLALVLPLSVRADSLTFGNTGNAGGDLSGTYPNPTAIGIHASAGGFLPEARGGYSYETSPPAANDLLTHSGSGVAKAETLGASTRFGSPALSLTTGTCLSAYEYRPWEKITWTNGTRYSAGCAGVTRQSLSTDWDMTGLSNNTWYTIGSGATNLQQVMPAGTYVVLANVIFSATNGAASNSMACRLYDGSTMYVASEALSKFTASKTSCALFWGGTLGSQQTMTVQALSPVAGAGVKVYELDPTYSNNDYAFTSLTIWKTG